jgi:hypothetical protein
VSFRKESYALGDSGVCGAAVRMSFSVDRDFYAFENGGAGLDGGASGVVDGRPVDCGVGGSGVLLEGIFGSQT